MAGSNPNKVNQYTAPDPRQSLFLANYLDPKSETFSNAYQSAIKAGYQEEYAKVILNKDTTWLAERVKDNDLVTKAEKALVEALDYIAVNEEGKIDAGAGRLKLDAAKLVLKGLAKEKYSERVEQTGKDGGAIVVQEITGMKIVKE